MRYTRLRRQIESGTLIGTHGTRFAGALEKIAEAGKKRKRGPSSIKNDKGGQGEAKGSVNKDEAKGEESRRGVTVVKEERQYSWVEFESSEESDGDSEDEIPLAKLRKSKLASNAMLARMSEVPKFMHPTDGVSMPFHSGPQTNGAIPTSGFGGCVSGNCDQQWMLRNGYLTNGLGGSTGC